jgi:catechol 2,3-dioxygenase-like lactoylglutathione lyase family enzyme
MAALATFKDLCIDAVDHRRMASFWADVLGLRLEGSDEEGARLSGPTPQHTVWMCRVPEPVTVKQRVHLDVYAASLQEVLALGATPADVDSFRWKVVRDPEGGELCVFDRDEVPAYRLYELGVDAVDGRAIATWWAEVLGARVEHEDGWSSVEGIPGAPFAAMGFATVPEPKTVKNRIHWDLVVPDRDALLERGARVVRARDEEIRWTVMADPEGNEFCAFDPPAAG